jgi:hypothetical protein
LVAGSLPAAFSSLVSEKLFVRKSSDGALQDEEVSTEGLQVSVFSELSIAPQMFQFVEFPGFPVKDMNDGVKVVHTNPPGVLLTFNMERCLTCFFLQSFVDTIRDCLDLGVGVAFANYEKVGRCVIQFSQIQFQDILAFNILDAVDD